MDFVLWVSFLTYAVTAAVTPGPNNILTLNVVGNFGLRRSRFLLAGIYAGIGCVMLVCGVFSVVLARQLPQLLPVMKFIGCAYIVWLAYRVARAGAPDDRGERKLELSFTKGFILQFVNVKMISHGMMVFTVYVLPYYSSQIAVVGFIVLLIAISVVATGMWAAVGSLLSGLIKKYSRIINLLMALLLVYSALALVVA